MYIYIYLSIYIYVWAPYTTFIILDHLIKAKTFPENCMAVGEQDFPEHTDHNIDKETFISDHAQQEEL